MKFGECYAEPSRNGLTKPKRVRGTGFKFLNMGELFANRRINNLEMDRAPLSAQEEARSLLKEDDLLFARQSMVPSGAGKCVIFQGDDEPVTFDSHLIRVRLDRDICNPSFAFYYFEGQLGRDLIHSIVSQGAGVAGITGSDLRELDVDFPHVFEQRKVAALLSALDDKIELNRRMSATLEEMARALYRSWFVDFDPVHARAAGLSPAHMDPITAALFPDSFDPDGLPKGWEAGEVGDLITLQRGFDLPKKTRNDGPYPVMAAGGHHGTHNEFKVKGPGVTTGRSGVIGQVYLVADDFWPLNTSLWIKEFKGCSPYFAYFFLDAIDLAVLNSGSAVPSLNRNNVHNLIADIPPADIIEKFDELVSPMFARQHQLNSENESIATLRDTLLPRLMSGELRIREVERQVEQVI
jgi:type I restriction enzyme, S subunit